MEFVHNGEEYRVERGMGTEQWLLLCNVDHGRVGWRLLGSYSRKIKSGDIINTIKKDLDEQNGTAE